MNVAFSRRALTDLDGIFDAILLEASEQTASRVLDAIERRALSLDILPERGASVLATGPKGLRFVVEHPYLIVYRCAEHDVEIVTVVHGARDLHAHLRLVGD